MLFKEAARGGIEMDHELTRTKEGYTCIHCEQVWKQKPKSHCPRIKVYPWAGPGRPESYLTKTALHKKGLNPGGPRVGVIYNGTNHTYYDLYDEAQAVQRQATPEQLTALRKARATTRKARTCKGCKRVQKNERSLRSPRVPSEWRNGESYVAERFEDGWCQFCRSREWERRETNKLLRAVTGLLADEATVALDTETTGLHRDEEGRQEIIELAILSPTGAPLFNSRFRPSRSITEGAQRVHGIALEELAEAPTFSERWPEIHQLLQGKRIGAFNVAFDERMFQSTLERYGLGTLEELGLWKDDACAMSIASDYFHQRRISLWETCERLGIQPGDHSALGDAQATLEVLWAIATSELAEERIPMLPSEPFVSRPLDMMRLHK
jgi:DNA polymerase III epsilon subunit-like protein